MTFVGVTCMDIANVKAHYSPSPNIPIIPTSEVEVEATTSTRNSSINIIITDPSSANYQSFYDASMAVLFDLPNSIVVSTYVLLTLVWADCFMQSRVHNKDTIKWKRRWLMGYTIFNSCLYFTQLVLYALVILDGSMVVKNILYAALTGINLCAIALVTFLYFYLNIKFAGYPHRSAQAKTSLERISKVLALWTVSRGLFAITMLIVFVCGIELLHFSSLLLLFLFVACEIVPIAVMLDYSYIQIIGFESADGAAAAASNQGGGGVSASLVEQEFSGNALIIGSSDEWWLGGFGFGLDDPFNLVARGEAGRTTAEEPLLMQV